MATRSLEQEVKLDADLRFEVPDLSAVAGAVAGGAAVVRHPVRRLVATYYDTPDLQLLRRGVTLRRRQDRVAGGENLWTLKLPDGTQHATMARTEHSWPGAEPEVPAEARFLVRGLARRTELVMVAKLLTTRRSVGIVGPTGEQLVEVDDDVVSVVRGVRQGLRFREIEVEDTGGDADLVDAVVALLGRAGASPGERRPKLDRALGVDLGRSFEVDPPGPDATVEDLVRQSIAAGVDRLLDHDPGLRVGGSDIEFVHQARVATRRLRSDLKLLGDILDPAWVERVRDELRWLGGMLGGVRDADVLTDHLVKRAKGAAAIDAPAIEALQAVLATQREHARTGLLRAIESERYLDLIGDLTAAVALPPVRPTRSERAYDDLVRHDARSAGADRAGASAASTTGARADPGAAAAAGAGSMPPALAGDPTASETASPIGDPTGGWPETAWGAPVATTVSLASAAVADLDVLPTDAPPALEEPGDAEDSHPSRETDPSAAAAEVLPHLLGRQLRKLRRAVRAAGKHPADDQLHAIRIRAKQLRYAAEAATPVLGKEVRRLAERAGSLQQVLGDLHDSITAEAWLRQTASSGTSAEAFGAGLLVVREQEEQDRLRRRWLLTWRALALQAKRVTG